MIRAVFNVSTETIQFWKEFEPTPEYTILESLKQFLKGLLETRKSEEIKYNDFVDVLGGLLEKLDSSDFVRNGITENTVLAQAVSFLTGGFDSVSTAVSVLGYYLAKNPEFQNDIIAELDQVLERDNGRITFEGLSELSCLSACVMEALRLCPIFIRPKRICSQDWESEVRPGLKIKEGMLVVIPTWVANRNPEIYDMPETFNPYRKVPDNQDKYAFSTFGHGPKNCVAIRMAIDTIKIICASFLKTFRFKESPDTVFQFEPVDSFFVQFAQPLYLDLEKR